MPLAVKKWIYFGFLLGVLASNSSYALTKDFDLSESTYYSPAMMEQSLRDIPGPMTVITGEQLQNYGVRTIPEAMRLVPGFFVRSTSPMVQVNRGLDLPAPRRLLVLVDGVSVLIPLLSTLEWMEIPVPIESIRRIEVIRSQSSMSYGANAYYASINIITRDPAESLGTHVATSFSGKFQQYYGRQALATGENSMLLLDVARMRGHDLDAFEEPQSFNVASLEREDDLERWQFGIAHESRFDGGGAVKVAARLQSMNYDRHPMIGLYGTEPPRVETETGLLHLNASIPLSNHVLNVDLSSYIWRIDSRSLACMPQYLFMPGLENIADSGFSLLQLIANGVIPPLDESDPTIAPLISALQAINPNALDDICGDIRPEGTLKSNMFQIADVWYPKNWLRSATAFALNDDSAKYSEWGDSRITKRGVSLYNNTEIRVSEKFTLNAGLLARSFADGFGDDFLFSKRLAVNWHMGDWTTLKLVASSGRKNPIGIEGVRQTLPIELMDRTVDFELNEPSFGYYGDEKISTNEVIYLVSKPAGSLEVRAYEERVDNPQDSIVSSLDMGETRQGFELQVRQLLSTIDLYAMTYYMHSKSNSNFRDYEFYGGAVALSKQLADYRVTGAYYGTSSVLEYSYDRFDLFIGKQLWQQDDAQIEAKAFYRHYRDGEYIADFNTGLFNSYNTASSTRSNQNEIGLELKAAF